MLSDGGVTLAESETINGSKHRLIEDELISQIESGVLAVGQRLSPGRTLAIEYSVSRPTADKAITNLATRGYVERTQGRGTFVRDWRVSAVSVGQADSISLVCTQYDMNFHAQFLYGANKEAEKEGYHLTYSPMGNSDDGSVPLVIRKNRTLGTLILGPLSDTQAEGLLAENVPHLFVGNHRNTFGQPCVRFDMVDAGYQITKKLLELDRGPIWLFIEPTIKTYFSQELLDGYQRAILEHPDVSCNVHICRRSPIDRDLARLMEQMTPGGEQDFCMMGNYTYILRVLQELEARGTDINHAAVAMVAESDDESDGIDRMVLCDGSITMLAEEGVRQLAAHAKEGTPVTGKSYKLQIESVNDQVRPLRFSWK